MSKPFNDTTGRTWLISVDADSIRRVRDLTGVELQKLPDNGFALISKLATDYPLLCDVLFALIKPQADKAEPRVTDEDFGRSMRGDELEAGFHAMLDAACEFFPKKPRLRMEQAIAKVREMVAAAERKLDETMPGALASIDTDTVIESMLKSSARPLNPEQAIRNAAAAGVATMDAPAIAGGVAALQQSTKGNAVAAGGPSEG